MKAVPDTKGDNITVTSSHGTLLVDRATGRVVDVKTHDGSADSLMHLKAHESFDLDEYCKHYEACRAEIDDIDILDLRCTLKGGGTHEPSAFHRKMMKRR